MTIPAPATALPWHLHDMEDATICGPDRMAIGLFFASSRVDEDNIKNANYALTACNSFPALVAAGQRVIAWWEEKLSNELMSNAEYPWAEDAEWDEFMQLRKALSLALGEQ